MSKKAPSTTQLLVIAGFALSCFGILLFLWITFGGPTPFKAKSYEITIPFDEATQLAEQSDVRISGVNVGKVKNIERDPDKLAIATIEIDDKYAPIPQDTRAILRTKTLLAETYVELTPGDRDGPKLEDGGTPARRQRRPLGPDRRDLPHLRPAHPGRLPGMDAGSSRSRSTAAARASPPRSANSTRPSANSTSSSAPWTPSGWPSGSCSATAPSPSTRFRGREASSRS